MFSLALKNVWYYKGRSITTFILTFISAFFFIVYVAMQDGSHDAMLKNALKVYTGSIEIYAKDYRDIGGNDYLIEDVKSITDELDKIEGIRSYSSRYETFGLLSHKDFSAASMMSGIQALKEADMTQLKVALRDGEYLDDSDKSCIYMGYEIAKKLHTSIGSKISFIGSSSDNSFAADIFTLCGTFKTGSFEFDSSASFVSRAYFDPLMQTENIASYISIQVENLDDVDVINEQIKAILPKDHESLTWKTLMETMLDALEVDAIFGYISISLFYIVIFFVILIYGFINVSSRIKEFGTLRCIGLSGSNIRNLLLLEVFIVSTAAILIATPVGGYIAYYFSVDPIVIEGMSEMYKDYGIVMDEIPFSFDIFTIAWNLGVVYALNFLSVVYPISFINSFKPIEAAKHV
jgi:ABC-type lipoprotein release transport system permease subunit